MHQIYNVVHLAVTREGEFELQLTLADEPDRLFMMIGTCLNAVVTNEHPVRVPAGIALGDLVGARGGEVLLRKSELQAARHALAAVGYADAILNYYAIVNLFNTSLIAEHRLSEDKRYVHNGRFNEGNSSIRKGNHA